MKKIFILLIVLLYTPSAFSQSVLNPSASTQTRSRGEVNQVSNPNRGYGYSNYGSRGYATGSRDYITLKNIEDKIEQLKIRIKESEKYGDHKKESLENELNHALRKFKEADYNGDGILDDREQEVYGDDSNIFIDY